MIEVILITLGIIKIMDRILLMVHGKTLLETLEERDDEQIGVYILYLPYERKAILNWVAFLFVICYNNHNMYCNV